VTTTNLFAWRAHIARWLLLAWLLSAFAPAAVADAPAVVDTAAEFFLAISINGLDTDTALIVRSVSGASLQMLESDLRALRLRVPAPSAADAGGWMFWPGNRPPEAASPGWSAVALPPPRWRGVAQIAVTALCSASASSASASAGASA